MRLNHRRERKVATVLIALIVSATACFETTPMLPSGAQHLVPPPVYALWWDQVEACSDLAGSIDAVKWYTVPGVSQFRYDGREAAGVYEPTAHRIIIAGNYLQHGSLVRHEMLHALAPTLNHPREYFRHRCGDVVACVGNCLTEAGSPPARGPEIARIEPSELEVAVSVVPASPSAGVFGGRFVLVVTARNPNAHEVVVNLPPSGDAGPSVGFTFGVAADGTGFSLSYNGRIYDAGAAYFRAGETKRAVFDFSVGPAYGDSQVTIGSYTASGGFSTSATASVPFVVMP